MDSSEPESKPPAAAKPSAPIQAAKKIALVTLVAGAIAAVIVLAVLFLFVLPKLRGAASGMDQLEQRAPKPKRGAR
jgi:hypothetical protein